MDVWNLRDCPCPSHPCNRAHCLTPSMPCVPLTLQYVRNLKVATIQRII